MATKKDAAASGKGTGTSTGAKSTAVAVRGNTNVVNIQEQLRKQAEAMADRTAPPGGSKIKIPQSGGKFILPNGQEVQGQLEAVIVDFRAVNAFYAGKYDPKNIQPPSCYAVSLNPRQMAPVNDSPDKQSENCQSCPNNAFGSDGDGKACKNMRRLAILPPKDNDETAADVDHDLWVLDVSPSALRGFDGFVQTIARTFQTPPCGVVVTIGFDPNVDYGKLVFSNPRPISNVGDVMARQEEAGALLDAHPDFTQLQQAAPAKPANKRVAAGGRR